MDPYSSDREQVEVLKTWWRKNGMPILAGVGIGLGGLYAWRAWQAEAHVDAEQASSRFEQLVTVLAENKAAEKNKTDTLAGQAEQILDEHGGTVYASFATLALARIAVEAGDLQKARERLQWVLDHTRHAPLKRLAKLRLARVLLSAGETDKSSALVEELKDGPESASYQELKGDVLRAQGRLPEARRAYDEALKLAGGAGESGPPSQASIQLKLDTLGISDSAP
jgi:predicted negative regulator of RcsB-dependent stress response